MLSVAVQALAKAAAWFVQMLAAAVLAVLALVLQVLGAALALLVLIARLLTEALQALALAIKTITPVAAVLLFRLVCVGVEVYAAYVTFPRVLEVYGLDVTGALLAGLVVVCPLAFAMINNLSWGGLVVAGLVTLAAGLIAPTLPPTARALVIGGALGAVIFYFSGGYTNEQESGRYSDLASGRGLDGLHSLS